MYVYARSHFGSSHLGSSCGRQVPCPWLRPPLRRVPCRIMGASGGAKIARMRIPMMRIGSIVKSHLVRCEWLHTCSRASQKPKPLGMLWQHALRRCTTCWSATQQATRPQSHSLRRPWGSSKPVWAKPLAWVKHAQCSGKEGMGSWQRLCHKRSARAIGPRTHPAT